MHIGSVFENNRTQAIRLPAETRFPETVKNVIVRTRGKTRILEPVDQSWDSFFHSDSPPPGEDFMPERATQVQPDRESL
jgi:antitoxin VapB